MVTFQSKIQEKGIPLAQQGLIFVKTVKAKIQDKVSAPQAQGLHSEEVRREPRVALVHVWTHAGKGFRPAGCRVPGFGHCTVTGLLDLHSVWSCTTLERAQTRPESTCQNNNNSNTLYWSPRWPKLHTVQTAEVRRRPSVILLSVVRRRQRVVLLS